jgi:hypothetical protein
VFAEQVEASEDTQMMQPEKKDRKSIGFQVEEDGAAYV